MADESPHLPKTGEAISVVVNTIRYTWAMSALRGARPVGLGMVQWTLVKITHQ